MALALHGGRGPRRARGVVHRLAGRHRHRHRRTAGPRSSRSRATASARRSPTGKVAIVAGFQGVSTDARHHHARPRRAPTSPRSRSPPRSTPTCARSTPTSKACTPPIRASCPTARKLAARLVRRDARDGGDRRARARAALGRVRAQPPREGARSFELHLGAGHLGHRGGRAMDASTSMEQAIISGVTHDTSEAKVTIEQVPDRPGVAATCFRDARRRGRQRRHDRAERVDRGPHRHLVHRAAHRSSSAPRRCMEKIVVDTEASGYRTDARIGRVSLDRRGHEDPPRYRRPDVRDARRRGHQHRDDQHVDDPDLVRGRRR